MAMRGVHEVVHKVGGMFEVGGEKDAIDLLKADHRKVEELFWQFQHARSASNKQEVMDKLIKELLVHAMVEESLVYPLLEDSRKTADEAADAYEEHHIMKMALAELARLPATTESVKPKIRVLQEIVRRHIKHEEMHLLPQLRRSGTDLERLAMEISRRKQQLQKTIIRSQITGGSSDRRADTSSMSMSVTGSKSEKSVIARKGVGNGSTVKASTARKKVTKKSAAGKIATKKATTGKMTTKKTATGNVTTKKAATGKLTTKKTASKKVFAKKKVAGKPAVRSKKKAA